MFRVTFSCSGMGVKHEERNVSQKSTLGKRGDDVSESIVMNSEK